MKATPLSLPLAFLLSFSGTAACAQWFGTPLQDVRDAAANNNYVTQHPAICGNRQLSTDDLMAYMLVPTWWEVTGADAFFLPPRTPSPMTLGRGDPGTTLFPNNASRSIGAPAHRIFWHTGIGAWQLDDSGLGSGLSAGKFNNRESAPQAAYAISKRICHTNDPLVIFHDWYGCADDQVTHTDRNRCVRSLAALYKNGSLIPINQDPLVMSQGGAQPYICTVAGQTGAFPCLYVDPGQAQGYHGTADANPYGFWSYPDAALPLSRPFYVYEGQVDDGMGDGKTVLGEVRYWMTDPSIGQDFSAGRPYGTPATTFLQWTSDVRYTSHGLCDVLNSRGACPGQFRSDGVTPIPVGAATTESTVKFRWVVSDPAGQQVRLEIELRRLDENGGGFTGHQTQIGELGSSGRLTEITVFGLIKGNYHWRARSTNSSNQSGPWMSLGNKPASTIDFAVGNASCHPSVVSAGGILQATSCGGQPPQVTTTNGSAVTRTTAVLNASINPEQSSTNGYFEYWNIQTPSSVNQTAPQAVGSDASLHAFSQNVSGLHCGMNYSFRGVATNSNGTTRGTLLPLATASCQQPGPTCYTLSLGANNPNGGSNPVASPQNSSGCGSGQYTAGEIIQLTAFPASGWNVASWTGTQNDTSTSTTNSLSMPASSHTVTVNYIQATPNPLTILTTSLPNAAVGVFYTAQLAATGGTGNGYTWSLPHGSLPLGLGLNALTGVISGTPASNAQTSDFTIEVQDSGGHTASQPLSIAIPQGMYIFTNAPGSFLFLVGSSYTSGNSITYLVENGQAPYSWAATGLPPGLQIDGTGGFLYGTPTVAGSFPAEIMVTDAVGRQASLSQVLRVVVGQLIITDSSGRMPPNPPTAIVGTSYQFFLEGGGGSQSGYSWSIQNGSLPPGLSGQRPAGCTSTTCALEISGTPAQIGSFSFTVVLQDSLGDQATQALIINVDSGNPPSITTAKFPRAYIGSSYSTALAATNGTPPYTWSFVGSSPDPGVQLSSDGTLSGPTTVPNDCPTGSTDGPAVWIGTGYPTTYFTARVQDAAGQVATKQLCLVSYYPTPQLTDTNPSPVVVDGQQHTVLIEGSNFRSNAVIEFGSGPIPTSYVSPSAISFTLYPSSNSPFGFSPGGSSSGPGPAEYWLSVVQPYCAFSATVTFWIYAPVPTITSVSPVLVNTSQPCTANSSCQLVVNGSGFLFSNLSQFTIVETGTYLPTDPTIPGSLLPYSEVTTASFSIPAGTYTLRVKNITPNGPSNTAQATFVINP